MKTIKELNLSEKVCYEQAWRYWYFRLEDIKEFIRLLKESMDNEIRKDILHNKIDKLVGDKLI